MFHQDNTSGRFVMSQRKPIIMSPSPNHAAVWGDREPGAACGGRVVITPARSLGSPLVRHLLKRIKHWRRSRQAERDLMALDDRLLKDIGISRADIPQAVRGLGGNAYKLTYDQPL
jgi:uncharacterized protein YjiS (DUF1127 family)